MPPLLLLRLLTHKDRYRLTRANTCLLRMVFQFVSAFSINFRHLQNSGSFVLSADQVPAIKVPRAPNTTSCAVYSTQNTQHRARALLS